VDRPIHAAGHLGRRVGRVQDHRGCGLVDAVEGASGTLQYRTPQQTRVDAVRHAVRVNSRQGSQQYHQIHKHAPCAAETPLCELQRPLVRVVGIPRQFTQNEEGFHQQKQQAVRHFPESIGCIKI